MLQATELEGNGSKPFEIQLILSGTLDAGHGAAGVGVCSAGFHFIFYLSILCYVPILFVWNGNAYLLQNICLTM